MFFWLFSGTSNISTQSPIVFETVRNYTDFQVTKISKILVNMDYPLFYIIFMAMYTCKENVYGQFVRFYCGDNETPCFCHYSVKGVVANCSAQRSMDEIPVFGLSLTEMLHVIIMQDTAYCNSQKDGFFKKKIIRGDTTKMVEVYCTTSVSTGTTTWPDYPYSTHAENKEITTPFSTTAEGNTESKVNTVMGYGLHNQGGTGTENEERTLDFTAPGSRETATTDGKTDARDPQNEEMKMTLPFDFTYSGPREATTGAQNEEKETFDFSSPGSREAPTTTTDPTGTQNEEMTFDFTYSGLRETTTIVSAGTSNFTTEHSTVGGIGLIHLCINTVVIIVGIMSVIVMVSGVNSFFLF